MNRVGRIVDGGRGSSNSSSTYIACAIAWVASAWSIPCLSALLVHLIAMLILYYKIGYLCTTK